MKTYAIPAPSIGALLDANDVYFEGIQRPLVAYMIRDGAFPPSESTSKEHIAILERYFSDISNLFMKKLALFSAGDAVSSEESLKLQALLQEMIKVKELIESATKSLGTV